MNPQTIFLTLGSALILVTSQVWTSENPLLLATSDHALEHFRPGHLTQASAACITCDDHGVCYACSRFNF